MSKKINAIIKQLQDNGYRITEQRKSLIEVILANECSTCKEIYYKVLEKDPNVGIATVYRTVSVLENLKVLNRNNNFDVAYEHIMGEDDEKKNAIFTCVRCGESKKIEIPSMLMATKDRTGKKQVKVLNAVIKGVCPECEEREANDKLHHRDISSLDCSQCDTYPCKVS